MWINWIQPAWIGVIHPSSRVSCTLKASRTIHPGKEWTNQSEANSISLHEFGSKQYIYLLIGWLRCLRIVCIVYGRNWFDWIIAGFAQHEFSLDHERQYSQPLPSLEQRRCEQNRVKVRCGLWFIASVTNRRCHFNGDSDPFVSLQIVRMIVSDVRILRRSK